LKQNFGLCAKIVLQNLSLYKS